MRIRWRQIPGLAATPAGRLRLRQGLFGHTSGLLLPLAGLYRRSLSRHVHVTAVIGSYGKTTTARAIAAVLGLPIDTYHGWNAGSYLASMVLHTSPSRPHTVYEVGISRPGVMRGYARVLRPDAVVVTSIGMSHHESLRTLEGTRDEKCDMVRSLRANGIALLNADDHHVMWMRSQTKARTLTFGYAESASLRASDVRLSQDGTCFALHTMGGTSRILLPLYGRHMVYPALAAIGIAQVRGISTVHAVRALQRLSAAPQRLEPIRLPSGALLIDDSYKSDMETIEAGLEVLRAIPAVRRVAVLGEITEPRRPQGPFYVRMGALAAGSADRLIFVGGRKGLQSVRSGVRRQGANPASVIHAHHGPYEVVEALASSLAAGDVVLVKGRRIQHLERVALHLQGIDVGCDLRLCRMLVSCHGCPMLHGRDR